MQTDYKTKAKDLLIDFSSDPFMVGEMNDAAEITLLGSVPVDVEINVGSAVQRLPNLRKNFPYIVNPQLRGLCWRSILESVLTFVPDCTFPIHAILPQTWRWQESSEFQKALSGMCGIGAEWSGGRLLSETICIAGVIAPLMERLREIQKKEPLRLLVVHGESDGCRHWLFNLFTSLSPALLRLKEYAPAWCAHPRLPGVAKTGAAIVTGDAAAASRELERSGFFGERLNGSSIVEGASRVLKCLKGQDWSFDELRLEMAPALGWRLGSDTPEVLVEPGTLLDQSNFPLPKIESELTSTPDAEQWGNLSFGLEAGWGSLPESWTPIASVQVPRSGQERIRLALDMQTSGEGTLTAQISGRLAIPIQAAKFKLLSALV